MPSTSFFSNTPYREPAQLLLYAARTTACMTSSTQARNPHVCTGCMRMWSRTRTMHNTAPRSRRPEHTGSFHELVHAHTSDACATLST